MQLNKISDITLNKNDILVNAHNSERQHIDNLCTSQLSRVNAENYCQKEITEKVDKLFPIEKRRGESPKKKKKQ